MHDDLADDARKTMSLASEIATKIGSEYISSEHVLLALTEENSGVGAKALSTFKIGCAEVTREINKLCKLHPKVESSGAVIVVTPRVRKIIRLATEVARELGQLEVGSGHLLLGMLRELDSVAFQILLNCGVKPEEVESAVRAALTQGSVGPEH